MLIGICDDTENDRKKIHNWLRNNHPSVTDSCIFEFSCGEAVIEFLNSNQLDVLFLDCHMCGINCIDCAKSIRKKDKKIKIIVTTDFIKYAPYGYDAEVYRFILKKQFELKINEVFNKLLQENNFFNEKFFSAKTDRGIVRLLVSDIVYVESILRKKHLILIDKSQYNTYSRMSELEVFFEPYSFVRPHNSYLINSIYVSRFTNEEIILSSDITIPISRKYAKSAYVKLMDLLS